MFSNPLAIKLRNILLNMNSGNRITLLIDEMRDGNRLLSGCYIDRVSNNLWETHDGTGSLELDEFIHEFLKGDQIFSIVIDNQIN